MMEIESIAKDKLLSYLPKELREQYQPLFFVDESAYESRLVKAADKISAANFCAIVFSLRFLA